jgi:AcrR family transcriptional regulator
VNVDTRSRDVESANMTSPVEERTRLAIETCALQLFVERGCGATTLDDIADRAKVAPSVITRHFQTMEAILMGLDARRLLSAIDAAALFAEAGITAHLDASSSTARSSGSTASPRAR